MNIVIRYGGSSQVKDNIISLLREREGREGEGEGERREIQPGVELIFKLKIKLIPLIGIYANFIRQNVVGILNFYWCF